MTLIVPMYHKASVGRHGNSVSMLDAHFAFIARNCHCVLPGDPLHEHKLNVALTFDDAYFDFYAVVFPLLSKHRLRALLAVPVALITERADASATTRLQACSQRLHDSCVPDAYCTWPELTEMAASGTVRVAGHGFNHVRLDLPDSDLHTEIVVPQTMLAARTGQEVSSFVLPYGRFTGAALACAKEHYRYVFRIGSADNDDWSGNLLYRIDADEMSAPNALFSRPRRATYRMRRHWNALRSR